MAEEPKAFDDPSPRIDGHAFDPVGKWWSLCRHCNLARAAHTSSTIDVRAEMFKEQMETYGHVRYPSFSSAEQERERIRQGGRARIGYIGDDDDD